MSKICQIKQTNTIFLVRILALALALALGIPKAFMAPNKTCGVKNSKENVDIIKQQILVISFTIYYTFWPVATTKISSLYMESVVKSQ